ncbi:MAG: hypothetical protein ACR2KS_06870 [Candidatus Eremiobacter antarcticus]
MPGWALSHGWFWIGIFALGCYHGINPGMGWLFAVALGLQEKSRRTVFQSLPPITLGHLASVFSIVALAAIGRQELSQSTMRYASAVFLVGFGLYRGIRARHPRWVGMRVGFWGLALWAFIMSTGHGAGLMLLPFLLGSCAGANVHHMGMGMGASAQLPFDIWILAVALHTVGYLLTMIVVAYSVYEKFGVRILKAGWFNFDLVWALALVVSGIFLAFRVTGFP